MYCKTKRVYNKGKKGGRRMKKKELNPQRIEKYKAWLIGEEKSKNTVEKYSRDIRAFYNYLPPDKEVTKLAVIGYKEYLCKHFAASSVNSMLTALNTFFAYAGWPECRVKLMKFQRHIFCEKAKELSKAEYVRLLQAARKKENHRLALLIETICATGIRVSELRFITVEAVRLGRAEITGKGKRRVIFLAAKLCKSLRQYMGQEGIKTGYIFRTKSNNPLDRSNIWSSMKALCREAGLEPGKVFPHNLRHLFARTFYSIDKDIARLADLLGHSSIETTRIYTISSGEEHIRKINRLGLII